MLPQRLGGHAVIEQVLSRAFTVTYRAEQASLGRTVLLRALKPTVSAESPFAAELAREAAVLARLEHPAIVRLFDFVRGETPYLVLEDRHAVLLPELVARVRLSPEQAAAITLGVAQGLAHAHARGVVHRELGPSIVDIDPEGGVRILEFASAGVERLPSLPEPIEGSSPSREFEGKGEVRARFLAPEQLHGEEASARSDVFAIGALMRFLAEPDSEGALRGEARVPITLAPAEAPTPTVTRWPRPLERVLARCMTHEPDARYEDAGALAHALEAALAELGAPDPKALITRALADGKLGKEVRAPAAEPRSSVARTAVVRSRGGPSLASAARSMPIVFAMVVGGAIAIESARDADEAPAVRGEAAPFGEGREGAAPARAEDRGYLRVVASPWADVFVDGERVDTTPVGRAIPVRAGRHWVTFKHPSAPDEQRSIKVLGGQTVFVDVTMRVPRPVIDAGAPDAPETP